MELSERRIKSEIRRHYRVLHRVLRAKCIKMRIEREIWTEGMKEYSRYRKCKRFLYNVDRKQNGRHSGQEQLYEKQ